VKSASAAKMARDALVPISFVAGLRESYMDRFDQLIRELENLGLFTSMVRDSETPRLICATAVDREKSALFGNSCQLFWENERWVICTWAPACYQFPPGASALAVAVACRECLGAAPGKTVADFEPAVCDAHGLERINIEMR
jgi:hypothetical protein